MCFVNLLIAKILSSKIWIFGVLNIKFNSILLFLHHKTSKTKSYIYLFVEFIF